MGVRSRVHLYVCVHEVCVQLAVVVWACGCTCLHACMLLKYLLRIDPASSPDEVISTVMTVI